jgi:hypothetical protein
MSECEHKNWEAAGYPESREYELGLIPYEKQVVFRVYSIYHVYCRDCGNFINLLTKETINDKGLVRINRGVLCSL